MLSGGLTRAEAPCGVRPAGRAAADLWALFRRSGLIPAQGPHISRFGKPDGSTDQEETRPDGGLQGRQPGEHPDLASDEGRDAVAGLALRHCHRGDVRGRGQFGADRLGDEADHQRPDRGRGSHQGSLDIAPDRRDLRGEGHRDLCADGLHGAGGQPHRRREPGQALPQADAAGRVVLHPDGILRHSRARHPERPARPGAHRPHGDIAGARPSDAVRPRGGDVLPAAAPVAGLARRRPDRARRPAADPQPGARDRREGNGLDGRDHEGDAGDRPRHPGDQGLRARGPDERPDGRRHRGDGAAVERDRPAAGDHQPADGDLVGLRHRARGLDQRRRRLRRRADDAGAAHVLRHRAPHGL